MSGSTGGVNWRWRHGPLGAALLTTVLAACGGSVAGSEGSPSPAASAPPLQAVVVNAAAGDCAPCVVKGTDRRLAVGILDSNQVPVGGGVTVQVQVYLLPAGGKPTAVGPVMDAPYEGTLLADKGVYVIRQNLAAAGFYNVVVSATKGALHSVTTAAFQVLDADPGLAVGSPAPSSQNPTASQVSNIRQIDTGVPPDDMHYTSIAAALSAHHALVIYFGAPGFCKSKTCAPEQAAVASLEPAYKPHGVDFVHIETYKGGVPDNTADFSKATLSPTFDEWKLTSDPWVFVVDKAGLIRAKFDGPTAPEEIEAVLKGLV
ncbi:MAG TPA: hypothetical protein VNV65_12930 [Candidatus Solibacter sp.]|nr:hypothetical protein [Candidatus Solibacter sp.]